jgi:hypothetical protein
VLAYVFWHRPREREDSETYERLVCAFHRSLARSLPAGMIASAAYRLAELPWEAPSTAAGALDAPAYEDWYLVEDFAALGVLNEAAVGRGHRSSHDDAAQHCGAGTAGLYALLEGDPTARALGDVTLAVWVTPTPHSARDLRRSPLAELLGDGMEPHRASLWRRQLVFGPAPEYCLISSEVPCGVGAARLPEGWTASVAPRELVWSG